MKRLLATASLFAAFATPVWPQQQGNPAGATPGTESRSGMPAPTQPNVVDRNFARAAAAGGLAEVELGRLADQNGKSSGSAPVRPADGQRSLEGKRAISRSSPLRQIFRYRTLRTPKIRRCGSASTRCRETPSTATISEARSPLTKRPCNFSNMKSGQGRIRS